MDDAASPAEPEVPDGHTGDGGVDPDVEHEAWRQLLFWVGLAELVVCVAVVVVAGAVIPPVVVFGIVFLVGLVLLVRPGRVGPVTLGVASILFVLVNLPFVVDDLAHPDSFATFFPAAIGLLAGVVGAVALAGFLRRWPVRAIGRVGAAASALALVALGVGLAATLTVEDDVPQEGDLALATEGVEWVPDTLIAGSAGDVAVFISNTDPYRHTFAIDDLDVEVELPADTDRRASFTAAAGEYEFHCTVPGHEDMTGTLTVPR